MPRPGREGEASAAGAEPIIQASPLGLLLTDGSPLTAEFAALNHARATSAALNARSRRDELATLASQRGLTADELSELRSIERNDSAWNLKVRLLGDLASAINRGISLFEVRR